MYLTGHVPLKRMDRRSQMARRCRVRNAARALDTHAATQECLNACRELLRNNAPVLFFPEARQEGARACLSPAYTSPHDTAGDAQCEWPDGRVQEGGIHRRR